MKHYLFLFILIVSLASCEEEGAINESTGLEGNITGNITTYDEFGHEIKDYDDITITLEGSDPVITSSVDTSGAYEIANVPTGTYIFKVAKNGYNAFQKQGLQVIGGEKPIYLSARIIQVPITGIVNLSAEASGSNQIKLQGTIEYDDENQPKTRSPIIRYFLHTDANPSPENYLATTHLWTTEEKGESFESYLPIDNNLFPSGSQVYIVAYPASVYHEERYYDITTNTYVYTSLGEPSDIKQITIP